MQGTDAAHHSPVGLMVVAMTVPSETSQVLYTGNGATTNFGTVFRFRLNSHVKVYTKTGAAAEVLQAEGVHYSLAGAESDSGGTVVFGVAPANGVQVRILRDMPFVQEVDFSTFGEFSPTTHEKAFDDSVYRDQELDRRVSALESAGAPGAVLAGDGLAFLVDGQTLHVVPGSGIMTEFGAIAVDRQIDDQPEPVGTVGLPGTSTKVSPGDHVHAHGNLPGGALHANASGATAGFMSAADKSALDTLAGTVFGAVGSIQAVGTAAAAGVSGKWADAEHVHPHGNLTGGALHALAVAGVSDGFMSGADKALLDAIVSGDAVSTHTITTSDATPTILAQFTPSNESAESVEIRVAAKGPAGGTVGAAFVLLAGFFRRDNTTSQIGSTTSAFAQTSGGASAVALTVTNPTFNLQVTGLAATTIKWVATVRRVISRL